MSASLTQIHPKFVNLTMPFRDMLDGRIEAEAAYRRLAALVLQMPFGNGFLHGAPGAHFLMAKVGAQP